MENLLSSIEDVIHSILNSDPAVYRIIITDNQGMEIVKYAKSWALKPNEDKVKNPIYPLLNSISTNAEKFLNFLREDPKSPFVFSWYFDNVIIFAATSPFGFIGVFCDPDVDQGLVKNILYSKTRKYNQLVSMVFRE